jgi:hypothetical protein
MLCDGVLFARSDPELVHGFLVGSRGQINGKHRSDAGIERDHNVLLVLLVAVVGISGLASWERRQLATHEAMLADRIVTMVSQERLTVDQIRDEVSEDDRSMVTTTLARLVNQHRSELHCAPSAGFAWAVVQGRPILSLTPKVLTPQLPAAVSAAGAEDGGASNTTNFSLS